MKPLESLLVIEFSQYLSGPSATLRLADLGARVIKVERTTGGDGNRHLSLGVELGQDSLLFATINRNKESYAADLKNGDDLAKVKRLVSQADVLVENFRPGVMARLGLDYAAVHNMNPQLVYGRVTGYGDLGPWRDRPGQDLLVQSLSGLAWLNGNRDQPPMPFGLAIADLMAGAHLAQGILALLVRRGRIGRGGLVEVSLMESALDLQVEVLTTYLNDGGKPPQRAAVNNAHAYLPAPYGIYQTKDGYLALAMGSLLQLADLLQMPELRAWADKKMSFEDRDMIKSLLADRLRRRSTQAWLDILVPAGYWCAEVLTWEQLLATDAFQALEMVQWVNQPSGPFRTTRCPIRIDGAKLVSDIGAPSLGSHTHRIDQEFSLAVN
ncbi:MAG: CoA transferase [Sulfobacillus acidophilus]|uniref:CoA transferase n=1 Tax=Sulfobacillus acidophilus TaxID=53633 RepID=A0A2T2WF57_9FIRM|nr:MAG: CoA transferase [Sulfobacillus acidophilus]